MKWQCNDNFIATLKLDIDVDFAIDSFEKKTNKCAALHFIRDAILINF